MKEKIIQLFYETEDYVSGEYLSELCGISRTAIWKHINALKAMGYEIESHQGKGYRLVKEPNQLVKVEIQRGLTTKRLGQGDLLEIHSLVESTNYVAKERAMASGEEGIIILAEQQSKGKGRLGRSWISPKGTGIWMSLVLKPQIPLKDITHFTFIAAVGVAKGIQQGTGLDVAIKWPNDLLIGRKKVCGILAEIVAEVDRVDYLIMGIGVNVNQIAKDFPKELAEKATSIAMIVGKEVNRNRLISEIVNELETQYERYIKGGFGPIKEQWLEMSNMKDQWVRIVDREAIQLEGQVIGLGDDGALLLLVNGKEERVIVGDVSLRLADGAYS